MRRKMCYNQYLTTLAAINKEMTLNSLPTEYNWVMFDIMISISNSPKLMARRKFMDDIASITHMDIRGPDSLAVDTYANVRGMGSPINLPEDRRLLDELTPPNWIYAHNTLKRQMRVRKEYAQELYQERR